VQFHWDREGKKDHNSSCWIRVAQPWAGKGFGMVHIPRIGQEVVVAFLEGDPDQPLIVGSVYNAEQTVPYPLPANKMVQGTKSNSTPGGGGYNELILNDTKGKELIRVHGQHDMTKTIEHDETTHVKHDRTETVDHDEKITVGNNRTETVVVNETITIGNNRVITVKGNEVATVALTRTHTVGINEMINVGGAQEINVGGLQTITVIGAQTITVGAAQAFSVGGGMALSVGGDMSQGVGKKLTVTAGDEIAISTGAASITMKKDGTIEIKGKTITLTATDTITEKATTKLEMEAAQYTLNASSGTGSVKAATIQEIKAATVKINC
jgi:type VI secretion system secreted protein VgrG